MTPINRICRLGLVLLALVCAPVWSQEGEGKSPPEQGTAQETLATLDEIGQEIRDYQAKARRAEGEEKVLLIDQLARSKQSYRKALDELVSQVKEREQAGSAGSELRSEVDKRIGNESKALRGDIEAVEKRLSELRKEVEKAEPDQLLSLEQDISRNAEILDSLLADFSAQIERMNTLGLDAGADREYLDRVLEQRARALAGRIELTLKQIKALKQRRAKATESEQKNIDVELVALEEKEGGSAGSLQSVVAVMEQRGLDTAAYRQLLITTTGEITGAIFDTDVASGLVQQWIGSARSWAVANGPGILLKIIVVVLILLVFKMLSGVAARIARRAVTTSKLSLSQLLQDFFTNLSAKAVMVIGLLVALSQLGVEIGPVLAGLGVVGFIVGFALQDTLSNFAAGLMILVYRPYDVGDVIEAGGVMGKVQQMSLVSTTVMTPDNQKLVVPNNKIWGGVIRNVTAQRSRRVDLVFGIGYSDDIDKAQGVLTEIVSSHELVLADPEPVIKLHTLGESSVDFVVRPWARTEDYWTVYWDITRSVKERFDAEGISIPFPQRDVHLHSAPGT